MELMTACRYFSCSRLVESACEGPGGRTASVTAAPRDPPRRGLQPARGLEGTGTCGGGVLGLEEAHDALAVQPPRAQQHGLGAGVAPAHHGEAVLPVAAGDALDRVVLDALRHDQQPGVAAGETGGSAEPGGAQPQALHPAQRPQPRTGPRHPLPTLRAPPRLTSGKWRTCG